MDDNDTMGEVPLPPYYETLGIEITDVEPGSAGGRLELTEAISSTPSSLVAHGGAIASLADSVGYMAASAANDFATTPTVDFRIDYLAPAVSDLYATADVVRNNSSLCLVDIEVRTEEEIVAVARGSFKSQGNGGVWNPQER